MSVHPIRARKQVLRPSPGRDTENVGLDTLGTAQQVLASERCLTGLFFFFFFFFIY